LVVDPSENSGRRVLGHALGRLGFGGRFSLGIVDGLGA